MRLLGFDQRWFSFLMSTAVRDAKTPSNTIVPQSAHYTNGVQQTFGWITIFLYAGRVTKVFCLLLSKTSTKY